MSAETQVCVREVRKSDVPFITNAWLKSFREHGDLVEGVPNTVYYYWHHRLIRDLLENGYVYVLCAHDEPDLVMGFAVCHQTKSDALVIHYVYVKRAFRGLGLAKRLFDAMLEQFKPNQVFASHRTDTMRRVFKKYSIVYNPYLLFFDTAAERKDD